MKVTFSGSRVKRFQEGGEMPVEAPVQGQPEAPEQSAGGDPLQQILQAAAQAVQNNDAELALQVCAALVQLAQGGGAPEPQNSEPVYRKGGVLSYRVRK